MNKKTKPVSWEAQEYIVRERDFKWYIGLFLSGVVFSALAIWQGWWTFLAVIILCIVALLTLNLRPPRTIHYTLDDKGLTEDTVFHSYTDYKAFAIVKEGPNYSAILIPKKRFGLSTKIYFPGTNGEAIVDALGYNLPMQEAKKDFLDKIVDFLHI